MWCKHKGCPSERNALSIFLGADTWGPHVRASSACTLPPRTWGCWSWPRTSHRTRRAQREHCDSSDVPWTFWSAPVLLCPTAGAGDGEKMKRWNWCEGHQRRRGGWHRERGNERVRRHEQEKKWCWNTSKAGRKVCKDMTWVILEKEQKTSWPHFSCDIQN